MFRVLFIVIFCNAICHAGTAFESKDYLIWISSSCPVASTKCKSVAYKHIVKSTGETIEIKGGNPVVGAMTGELIGYKFNVPNSLKSFEISMDLSNNTYLYIRDNYMVISKDKITRIKDVDYQNKLTKIRKSPE